MQRSEAIVSPEEIQILLNLLEEEISVMYPLYRHFTLFNARAKEEGYSLKILLGLKEFEDQQNEFLEFADEMPSYNDFISALIASGAMKYENLGDFLERAKSYSTLQKTVLFCPDTNVVYHRFITNTFSDFRNVLLIEIVRNEIESVLNFKYQEKDIVSMKKKARYQNFLLDEFVNRRMKRSRLAFLALTEYRFLRSYGLEIGAVGKGGKDKEENDYIIVKTLREFEKERSALPILLTADNQMADLCKAEGIEFFHFKFPHVVSADFCSHGSMLRLIYSLALIFGVIRLNSVVVFGEFRGKIGAEDLKLRFLDEKLWAKFEKHLRICRKLGRIGFEQGRVLF
ncbi:MAG: PIN domain-containing protein [Archaeoglobaceae archaeon]